MLVARPKEVRITHGLLTFCAILLSTPTQASGDPSVYRISPATDGSIVGTATLGIVLPTVFASDLIHRRCPCDGNEVNPLDRRVIGNANPFLDNLSDATAAAAVGIPILADWADLGWNPELAEDSVVFAEVLAVNGAFVTLAKYTVQRPLPRTYAGDSTLVESPGGYRSFYSGHTSLVFSALTATAVTLDLRYHAGIWPWLVAAGVGLSVAVERVAAGRHFYTDVAVGAAAGALIGTLIPLWHAKSPETQQAWHLGPAAYGAVEVSWLKHF